MSSPAIEQAQRLEKKGFAHLKAFLTAQAEKEGITYKKALNRWSQGFYREGNEIVRINPRVIMVKAL